MTFPDNDEFTRNLNDRIKELEDMTNEINDQTTELNDQANTSEDTDETTDVNQAQDSRTEGDTIFFTANVDSAKALKLNVTNNNGDVEVYGTDIDHVEIMATRQSGETVDHSHWFFQQVENEITLRPNWQVGSHVSDLASKLKTQLKEGFKTSEWSSKDFRFGMDVNYDIVVRLPKNLAEGSLVNLKTANGDGQLQNIAAKVDFKTANGDLSINGVAGDLTINSANGDLTAKGITGNANASTANGDVSLEGVTGSVEANTVNGDVSVNGGTGWMAIRTANGDAHVENVTVKGGRFATVAGDIRLDGVLNNASSISFDTVTGEVNVNVRVPAEGATLNTRSLSGDINTSGDWRKDGKRDWIIGEGKGPKLSAKSVSSDITINAVVDPAITLVSEDPSSSAKATSEDAESHKDENDININLDFEIERAKGWIKDMSGKLGALLNEADTRSKHDEPTAVVEPVEPVEPKAPEAPQVPEEPQAPEAPVEPVDSEQKTATADRRAKLLEAVKNGEMTVDEALAELERDA